MTRRPAGSHTAVWLLARSRLRDALPILLLALATPALAQPARTPAQQPPMPMDKAARMLGADERMKGMSPHQRMSALEFVTGNMVFVLQHEMGHAQISERALPVLGARDEDAADVFAILNMLKMGNVMSERVLAQAAMGWFLTARRDEKSGIMLTFYDAHGLDRQRAYQIVCLMVGSDPAKFKDLADESKLPKERRESCGADFAFASRGWEELLRPHRRAPDAPKVKIDVVYGEAKGKLDLYAQAARSMRLLENLADNAAEEFSWNAPFTLEMRSCGESGANWNPFTRKIQLCYELAEELAGIYRQFGREMKTTNRKPAR